MMVFRKGYNRKSDGRRVKTSTYYIRLRMADGSLREISTGCRIKAAASARAAELAKEQERIAAGVVTPKEIETAKHGRMSYSDAVESYIADMRARQCADSTIVDRRRYLEVPAKDLNWRSLRDVNQGELERWLSMRALTPKDSEKPDSVMGARVHNVHVAAFKAFGAWAFRKGYFKVHPFATLAKRNEQADRRHIRRALTPDELMRLFDAAEKRPLADKMVNRGSDANLKPETVDTLKWLGRTRALAYRVLAYTGLRYGELRSITIGAARLDSSPPYLELQAKDEKARRGAQIPLQNDLAVELASYLVERVRRLSGDCTAFPGAFDGEHLFDDLPEKMSRVFERDCNAAGIPKHDGAGRVIDVHALRHTFGTMLARAGVPLQVAQRAMRHSDPRLTANCYTHPGLMDISGAVNVISGVVSAGKKDVGEAGETASK